MSLTMLVNFKQRCYAMCGEKRKYCTLNDSAVTRTTTTTKKALLPRLILVIPNKKRRTCNKSMWRHEIMMRPVILVCLYVYLHNLLMYLV